MIKLTRMRLFSFFQWIAETLRAYRYDIRSRFEQLVWEQALGILFRPPMPATSNKNAVHQIVPQWASFRSQTMETRRKMWFLERVTSSGVEWRGFKKVTALAW